MQIINAYGTHSDRWPDEERAAAERQLAEDLQAQQLIANMAFVDTALDSYEVFPQPHLRNRILADLPPKLWVDRCLDWLLPSLDELWTYFWRPALAASLPLITGLLLGTSLFTVEITDTWEDEIVLIALDESSVGMVDE